MVSLIKPKQNPDNEAFLEFYTVQETGESGMSQTGLATLCGVSRQSIIKLEETLVTTTPSKTLEPFIGKRLTLVTSEDETILVNGSPAGNLKIYKASFCAAVIRHYDRLGNDVAQYSADQFIEIGVNAWIQGITGWCAAPKQTYIPYWYQRLTLFTARTRIPDGWWSVFEELAKTMRELEGYGYVLPDVSPTTGKLITPDISIGRMFCDHMRREGFDVDSEVRKYLHHYPDGRSVQANIYPDTWLTHFRAWFNSHWKPQRLADYLGSRDPEALPSISRLLGLPEAES